MNNKRVEKLIPKAIAYIQKHKDKFEKGDGINKVYSGYISSFGPSVITAGLLKTISFYDEDSNKKKIPEMFFELLNEINEIDINVANFIRDPNLYKDISIKNKILDVTVACKLAIKTFNLKE